MKKQQVTESLPETNVERYYREKNERRKKRIVFWKELSEALGLTALYSVAFAGAIAVLLGIAGGIGFFVQTDGLTRNNVTEFRKTLDSQSEYTRVLSWQLEGKADKSHVSYQLTTNGWVIINSPAR